MRESATPDPNLYRHIIDWQRRLQREGPQLLRQLRLEARDRRVLDLGCATGEHDRWLAAHGIEVVGVDRSPEMVAAAREAAAEDARVSVVEASIDDLPDGLRGPFHAAICLGNTLVHLSELAEIESCFAGVAARLVPGGRFLIQILNHEAIMKEKRRVFPLRLQPRGDGTELVFLRFMDHVDAGFIDFESVVLERRHGADSRLLQSRRSRLRAWTRGELVGPLERLLGPVQVFGTLDQAAYDAATSHDLVLLAERSAPAAT